MESLQLRRRFRARKRRKRVALRVIDKKGGPAYRSIYFSSLGTNKGIQGIDIQRCTLAAVDVSSVFEKGAR